MAIKNLPQTWQRKRRIIKADYSGHAVTSW